MSRIRPLDTEESREAAVLLVMLPPLARDLAPTVSAADLAALQRHLGPSVQVLKVDQAANPAVVRSFAPLQLPACVLVYRGVELWRQEGLPSAEVVVPLMEAQWTLDSQQVIR
ncbi:YbbN family protein [Hymenobacter fodinae]|uniref:Thioredoxin n=1 Tax=Hymenobacter fodinae TaxID=2510796 RepID=A0A4Z0P9Z7_9BACT|nr:thioredoxin [Hymenobacter fodinae]TGE08718.1 thioredoxin [Hymenobacter fodinae]